MRNTFRAAAVLAMMLLSGVLAVGWIGSERAIHPAAAHYRWTAADYPGLRGEELSIQSRSGAAIATTFFRGARRAAIVLSHGYGDRQQQMLPWAAFLHAAGYSVVTYDMRNRGRSGGDAVTLGALEPADLEAVVGYVASRNDVDRAAIGALGVSLGGAVTLLAAAADPRIGAVVDDSGFADAPAVIGASFEHFIGLPAFPFAPVTIWIAEARARINVRAVRPVDAVRRISPRPLLVIHCAGDKVVPIESSDRIFAAAGKPKEMWRIEASTHIGGHEAAREEYERRVVAFFDAWSNLQLTR